MFWFWRSLVISGCLFEVAALVTGRVPSITSLSHRARKNPWGAALVIGALAGLTYHLLIEGR